MIAMSMVCQPNILIADEPTTALDVTIQAQILKLMKDLNEKTDTSIILITHDLGVVAEVCDRVLVMYAGKIVEYGLSHEIFHDPRHPYTRALLSAMPDLSTEGPLYAIPGTPPDMTRPPQGDAFAARDPNAMRIDYLRQPPEFRVSDTHWAATWKLHPDAPKGGDHG